MGCLQFHYCKCWYCVYIVNKSALDDDTESDVSYMEQQKSQTQQKRKMDSPKN